MRVRFLDVNGLRTRVLHEGSGPPVLLLHGLGTTAERWLANIDVLGDRFAVHAPDLLGAGFSADQAYTSAPQLHHIAHLTALVDALSLREFSVVGSSYGGLLAALLALAMPDRVKRLVIVGSGSALHPPAEQEQVLKAARENSLKALRDATLEATRKRMERIVFRPESVPPMCLMVQLTANALPGRLQNAEQLYDAMIPALAVPEAQVYQRLEQILQPTLIVTGRNDIRASWQLAEQASKRIPDCQFEVFEECGHGPMFEQPMQFNALVGEFLASDTP